MHRALLVVVAGLTIQAIPAAVSADNLIIAGSRIGEVRLGDSQSSVRKRFEKVELSTPFRSYQTHGGCTADSWTRQSDGSTLEVVYKGRKVVQVEHNADGYKTQKGVSVNSTLAAVKKAYPHLKSTTYFFDEEDGKGQTFYDEIQQGIAYVVPSPWLESDKPEKPVTIIVHRPGKPAIPIDIKDPSNRSTK